MIKKCVISDSGKELVVRGLPYKAEVSVYNVAIADYEYSEKDSFAFSDYPTATFGKMKLSVKEGREGNWLFISLDENAARKGNRRRKADVNSVWIDLRFAPDFDLGYGAVCAGIGEKAEDLGFCRDYIRVNFDGRRISVSFHPVEKGGEKPTSRPEFDPISVRDEEPEETPEETTEASSLSSDEMLSYEMRKKELSSSLPARELAQKRLKEEVERLELQQENLREETERLQKEKARLGKSITSEMDDRQKLKEELSELNEKYSTLLKEKENLKIDLSDKNNLIKQCEKFLAGTDDSLKASGLMNDDGQFAVQLTPENHEQILRFRREVDEEKKKVDKLRRELGKLTSLI